jgi:ATP-binding cassette, subfamily B, bacterial MsbA
VKLYRRLLRYVRPYRGVFGLAIVGMLVVAGTDVLLLQGLAPLLRSLQTPGATPGWYFAVGIVGVFVLRGIGSYASEFGLAWIGSRVVFDLRCEACDHLLRLPATFFDASSAGILLSKVTFDAQQISAAASEAITVVIRNTLTIAFMLAYLLYLNWALTLLAFVAFPLVGIAIRMVHGRLRRMSRLVQDRIGLLTHVLEEAIGAHRVVKVFGGEAFESQRMRKMSNRLRQAVAKQASAAALGTPITQIIVACAVSAIVWTALQQSATGGFDAPQFMTYVFALLHLLNQLKTLSNVAGTIQRGLAAAESVFGLIDEAPEPDTGTIELGRSAGQITFENVTKRYGADAAPALSLVSLVIAPGESIALVGPSGGGKSTLANLIPRLYAPTEGRVLLDGQDIAAIRLKDLRRQIALVSQDIVLFNESVAANIAYGSLAGTSREAIESAAEAANALDFIRAMPQGFDTIVGERGIRLSGGQRQRIAIARAILKDAPILILDEATSALDTESERQVQIALDHLMSGRTTIVIAHRLSTIEHCDRIVVLESGRIAEQGTHRELLSRRTLYARLYERQFRDD